MVAGSVADNSRHDSAILSLCVFRRKSYTSPALMALMNSRALPARDSSKSFSTASVAGCRSFIHSRMGHVSRTRVFTFALLLPESCELFHQVAHISGGALKLSPGITFR